MDFDTAELWVKGAVIGHLIGDALGYPYENVDNIFQYEVEMVSGHHEEPQGSWSAPGAFSLATIDSINEFSDIDLYDIMEKFNDVYIAGYLTPGEECRDLSPTTAQAIKNYTNGMPPDKCGIPDATDNDCLARVLPVGLYCASNPIEDFVPIIHKVCRLTHSNPVCEATCAVYCIILRNILLQRPEKALEILANYYQNNNFQKHLEALVSINEYKDTKNPTGRKDVVDSFWSAWACHARNEQDFSACVTDAVYLGNDTNATAAISGSISALSNGLNDIPYKWLRVLRLDNETMEIIQTFVNATIKRNLTV